MYAAYFGLKQEPFSIAPDPRLLFMSEQHREALAQQGAESQVLGCGPVDVGAALDAFAALAEDPLELAVQVHRLGHRGHRQPDIP